MKLNDIMAEFEECFPEGEKTASVKEASPKEDDVDRLAAALRKPEFDYQTSASRFGAEPEQPFWEKIAESLAYAETIANLPILQKIASIEEEALKQGYTEKQISDAFEKKAAKTNYRSIIDIIFA